MRHGTTQHLNGLATYKDAATRAIKTEVPGWKPGDHDHNLALLLRAEHAYVMQEAQARGIDLSHLTHDLATDNILDGHTGTPITDTTLESLVDRLEPGASGVGATTLLRALVTGSALQRGRSGERVRSLHTDPGGHTGRAQSGKPDERLVSVARRLYYSRPSESAGGLPQRRVGDAVSGGSGGLAAALAETARFLNQKQPGLVNEHTHLFTTVEELLASDYARQHPFTAEQIASLRTAEGFHDGKTGHSIVIAENTRLLPGENPQQALTRVVLHERVGHAGLQILLGSAESPRARRWAALSAQIPQAELDAIAGQAEYQKLAGDRSALAYEWFARRTEKDASLLEKDSLPRQMWDAFREMVMDVMAHVGLNPTLGRSFETQVNDLKIRARNAALRPVSEQTLGTTSYSQRADTHNLQPHGNSLARAWKAFTQFDDAFQYGRTSSADLHDIAQAVSEPGMKVTAHDYGSYIRLQGKNGFLDIREVKTATPYISSMDADSAGEVRGGGSQLYQAALDWIHNNGKKVRSDPSGLTWINDTRRTSNLMASALRWGTTQHLSVHPDQGVPWAEGNHEANLTAMAKVEMANAFKAVAQARDWRYDFAHERFIDATGRELTRDDFDQAVVLGDPGTSGVGVSTLRRAVLTASAIEKSERGELEGIIYDSEVRGKKWGGLDRITYSLPTGAASPQRQQIGSVLMFSASSTATHEDTP
nr:hypothetical protein [Prosthecobacter dejongeii]